ncbi:MAG: GNAT family N-acetyltransferase [Pseudomonadota bacterium]
MASYASLGVPIQLPASGLRLLKRHICNDLYDLVGLYPYSVCPSVANLQAETDQAFLRDSAAVTISFILSPFQSEQTIDLQDWDVLTPFKEHIVLDLTEDWRRRVSKKTRYCIRRSEELHRTIIAPKTVETATLFHKLYAHTVRRHSVIGVQNFSVDAIHAQLMTPGTFVLQSFHEGECSGFLIGVNNKDHANYHLVAIAPEHYNKLTNYALLNAAIAFCASNGVRYFNLGGGAGLTSDASDGLYRFKRRWSANSLNTHLCGKILRPSVYAALTEGQDDPPRPFFPQYRRPGTQFEWRPVYESPLQSNG